MTDQEIEGYRQELTDIVNREGKKEELQELALKVGASPFHDREVRKDINAIKSVLVHNIHFALQTAAMANMCEVASKGHQTAVGACDAAEKSGKTMAAIAIIAALAAWAGVIVTGICR